MAYASGSEEISLCMATVDLDSLKTDRTPKVAQHMFLQEKAPWVALADDGSERWGTSEDAHLLAQR